MLLTPDQIIDLTGYRRPSAQVRALRRMGIRHWVRLDGRPVVAQDALRGRPQETAAEPNWGAINE